jgi:spermidine/putrescine transport system permease protein
VSRLHRALRLIRLPRAAVGGLRAHRWFIYLVYVFLYLPIAVVVVLSFTTRTVPAFPMRGFTLEWYSVMLSDDRLIGALFESVAIGVASAVGAGLFGTAAAFGMVRGDFRGRVVDRELLNTLFLAPIIVPWVVTGIMVLILYSLLNVQGSFWSVVLGHVVITFPFVVTVVATQLYNFDRSVEEAAKTLGAGELRTFYEVTLPIVSPGILAGMIFAFTISFDNFTQTFFWAGSQVETLPLVIYAMIRTGLDPSVNAIGTVIVALSLSLVLAAELLSSRLSG